MLIVAIGWMYVVLMIALVRGGVAAGHACWWRCFMVFG